MTLADITMDGFWWGVAIGQFLGAFVVLIVQWFSRT